MKEIKYENKESKYYIKDNKKSKRLIILVLISLFFVGICLIFSSIKKISTISNNEIGDVDYKVYLKDNDFYSDKYLGKGMQYIASLINTINVDFNYQNNYSDAVYYEYQYQIDAKILVTDKNDSSKVLYTKDEVIVSPTIKKGNDKSFNILENVNIDYEKYNSYVSAFTETYSLDVDSNLVITMKVNYKSDYNDKNISSKESKLNISIPLTKNTIDIKMDTNKLDNNLVIPIDESIIENKFIFTTGIFICSMSIILIIVLYLLNRKKNDIYTKEIKNLLKNYDRLIITSNQPDIDESNYKNKVDVSSFEELIDVNVLTNEPIIYYEVVPNEKSYFVILKQDTLYKLVITKEYLEKRKEDNKKKIENKNN